MVVLILGLFLKCICFLDVPETVVLIERFPKTSSQRYPFQPLLAMVGNSGTCGQNRSFYLYHSTLSGGLGYLCIFRITPFKSLKSCNVARTMSK